MSMRTSTLSRICATGRGTQHSRSLDASMDTSGSALVTISLEVTSCHSSLSWKPTDTLVSLFKPKTISMRHPRDMTRMTCTLPIHVLPKGNSIPNLVLVLPSEVDQMPKGRIRTKSGTSSHEYLQHLPFSPQNYRFILCEISQRFLRAIFSLSLHRLAAKSTNKRRYHSTSSINSC